MAELNTRLTATSPADFIGKVDDERRRKDCRELIAMMRAATGKPARMWGSIVGFDTYRLKYADGREIDMLLTRGLGQVLEETQRPWMTWQ